MTIFRAHGANPEKLYRSAGMPMPASICDFSTNTNAVQWNGKIEADLNSLLGSYPDEDASAVRTLIAAQNNCSVDEVLVTNGSNESIYLLASYQAAKENCIMQPAYGEYMTALKSYGASIRSINSMEELSGGASTVWICNPCNPTGAYIDAPELEECINKFSDKLFILDEAYIDFMFMGQKRINFLNLKNVAVLRSLTKIYHLCGARIGYVLAGRRIISMLKRRQPAWSVNSLAQLAAEAFLKDRDFPELTRKYYRREVPRLISGIRAAGYEVLPTTVNFFLVRVDDDMKFIKYLLARGMVVRHTRNFPGLDGRYVRIASRSPVENDRLVAAMKEYVM